MEEVIDIEEINGKIYSERKVVAATFLGGPLAAGYMIAENFKVFEQADKAKTTWVYALLFFVLILGISFSIPESVNFPSYIIPLISMALANFLMKRYQGENIASHVASNGEEHTWGRAFVISLIGLTLVLAIIFGVAFLLPEETL